MIGRRKRRFPSDQLQQAPPSNCSSISDSSPALNSFSISSPQSSSSSGNEAKKVQELLDLMTFLTGNDKSIRLKKFDLIRSKMEAKKLAEVIKVGRQAVRIKRFLCFKLFICENFENVFYFSLPTINWW